MINKLRFYFFVAKLFLKGNKICYIKEVIEEYKFKTIMLEFRSNALLFGFESYNYTDEEIIEMVNTASKQLSQCGVSAYEAGVRFSEASKQLAEFQPKFN